MGSQTSKHELLNNNSQCNTIQCANDSSSYRLRFTDETFDLFTLIWLDRNSNENDLESLNTKRLLIEINQDCLFYDNCNLFFNDINQMKFENKKILLIVSGSFVQNVLSKYNIKNSISIIIIFCRHYYKYASLKNDPIVNICTDHRSLKKSIEHEISSLKLNLFENQSLKTVRLLPSTTQNTVNNGIYFTYMLFIELLRQMPQTKYLKETMLNKCEDYYRGQTLRLKQIDEFRRTCTSDQAVKWYTRDTFVYRLVNRALKTEDITNWYLFRYYIIDLCMQLEDIHQKQEEKFGNRCLTLYRGQAQMPTRELKDIQSRIGSLVATNAFLSTSADRSVALIFASDAPSTDVFKSVLYEIIVDTTEVKNIVFIDVLDYLSQRNEANEINRAEKEILFTIGSIFKIENVYYDENENLWNIKMKATDEGTNSTKEQIELIKGEFQIGNMNLLFGRLLLNIGYYEKADSYFQLMLKVLHKDHEDLASVYDSIGDLKLRTTNWKEAYENLNHAYMLKKKYLDINHPDLGMTLNNIGNYYKAIENNELALYFYRKSLKCVTNKINTAITKLNIGTILKINGQYLQALEISKESFYLLQQINPSPYAEIIICHGLIGDIYCALYEYNNAEAVYLTAFELAKEFLFIGDHRLIRCINALVDIYEKQDNQNQNRSIDFCQQQLLIHKNNLSEDHVTIAHILMKLGELSNNIDYYQEALTIFQRNLDQEYASTANCLMLIGQYYDKREMYEKALSFYTRAYQIQTKIYPRNHLFINKTEILLGYIERKFKEQLTIRNNDVSNNIH